MGTWAIAEMGRRHSFEGCLGERYASRKWDVGLSDLDPSQSFTSLRGGGKFRELLAGHLIRVCLQGPANLGGQVWRKGSKAAGPDATNVLMHLFFLGWRRFHLR